jgi:hypothetical protein
LTYYVINISTNHGIVDAAGADAMLVGIEARLISEHHRYRYRYTAIYILYIYICVTTVVAVSASVAIYISIYLYIIYLYPDVQRSSVSKDFEI